MKRSAMVKLGLTSAMAASLAGCAGSRQEAQRCVDQNGRVVEEKLCDNGDRERRSGGGMLFMPYRWYYGGTGYALGALAAGGHDRPAPGTTPVRTSSPDFSSGGVTHGGFGATAGGEGSGGGE
jgi:hypothetical protein